MSALGLYQLSPEHDALREAVRTLAEKEIRPHAARQDGGHVDVIAYLRPAEQGADLVQRVSASLNQPAVQPRWRTASGSGASPWAPTGRPPVSPLTGLTKLTDLSQLTSHSRRDAGGPRLSRPSWPSNPSGCGRCHRSRSGGCARTTAGPARERPAAPAGERSQRRGPRRAGPVPAGLAGPLLRVCGQRGGGTVAREGRGACGWCCSACRWVNVPHA